MRLATVEAIRSYRYALTLTGKLNNPETGLGLELRIRRGISVPLTIAGGFANTELAQNYQRCREIAMQVDDNQKQFEALQGLWGCYCVGGYREETYEATKPEFRTFFQKLFRGSEYSLRGNLGPRRLFSG